MDGEDRHLLDALRRTRFLALVPTSELQRLAQQARYVSGRGGEILFRQGDPSEEFYIVLSGHVVMYLDGDGDPSKIARIAGPGESFGESCISHGRARVVTAQLFGAVELIAIPGTFLADAFASSSELALGLISEMSARLRTLVRQVMDLKMKTAAQRLGTYLLDLTSQTEGRAEIRLPFEKKLLASQLGMQPETLSRAMMKLQPLGVRYQRGRDVFLLPDVCALREFCDEGGPHRCRLPSDAADL